MSKPHHRYGVGVVMQPDMDIEKALRKLKIMCKKSGLTTEARGRTFFVSKKERVRLKQKRTRRKEARLLLTPKRRMTPG